ncbi:lysylphosphatidylglycerol synthase domain-containing protein [Neorhizobium sp. T786]|uniref:lysylphosphatidylglycerol synthase domain-containing protein n=1 Tax=Pseudorhizobium xiangyangii TaxID=2883104 RepID=UPI001CFF6861|nr:lysylphosphatidylglycerol synthase domain-containing protein [Neorhizobium xiangyangii]MCB5203617.1 lysylphosphatidylglycerol synthase domain-containing protein [Neorhizobium xiangyangii]
MNIRQRIFQLLIVAAVTFAAVLVYRSLGRYTWDEIEESLLAISGWRLVSAFGFVIASYVCLTGFDWLAVRYAGRPLSYRRVALASFTSLSIGHNVGLAALSSGAVRYRFYSRWGLTAEQVAKVIIFCGFTVGLGLATLAGISLIASQGGRGDLLGLSGPMSLILGFACLLPAAVYLTLCWRVRRYVALYNWRFDPPSLRLAVGQIVIGTLNFSCVAGCIHQLMQGFSNVTYLDVATAYVTANLAALISHVPGGLGVLEATILGVLPGAASIGALVAFRVIYFFIPLLIGIPTFLVSEAYFRRQRSFPVSRHAAS